MSKKRYVDTKFWIDNYVDRLDPSEKLVFIYLLTSPYSNVAGLYELPIRRMAIETGLVEETIVKIIKRLEVDKRVFYFNDYVFIRNYIKYQAINPNIEAGIKRELEAIPQEVLEHFGIAFQSLSKPSTNLNLNLNLNLNSNIATKVAPKQRVKTDIQQLVEHFFTLKGWTLEEKRSVFARFTKPAKELLELCDLQQAKEWLSILADWAKRTELDWSLSTMLKKWPERQTLAEKKQATFEGNKVIEKLGKLYVIGKDGEKREFAGKKEQLIYI